MEISMRQVQNSKIFISVLLMKYFKILQRQRLEYPELHLRPKLQFHFIVELSKKIFLFYLRIFHSCIITA